MTDWRPHNISIRCGGEPNGDAHERVEVQRARYLREFGRWVLTLGPYIDRTTWVNRDHTTGLAGGAAELSHVRWQIRCTEAGCRNNIPIHDGAFQTVMSMLAAQSLTMPTIELVRGMQEQLRANGR